MSMSHWRLLCNVAYTGLQPSKSSKTSVTTRSVVVIGSTCVCYHKLYPRTLTEAQIVTGGYSYYYACLKNSPQDDALCV